jgi:hypothetical protein
VSEAWLKAGTGDDKTDIVVIADFYNRAAIYSRDRYLAVTRTWVCFWGFDNRSGNFPVRLTGQIHSLRCISLNPKLFFSANSPPPLSSKQRNISLLHQPACAAGRIS